MVSPILQSVTDGRFWMHELCLDRWPTSYKPCRPGTWTATLAFRNPIAAITLLELGAYPHAFGVMDDFGNWVEVK